MKNQTVWGLVCVGGGAHGAYQAGVLKYIHERFSHENQSPFQIFTGSSCGALNTSFFASQSSDAYRARLLLESLWIEFHVPAYHGNLLKSIMLSAYKQWRDRSWRASLPWSLLDPKPMQDIISKGFKRENLERALRAGTTHGIAVAATELISGRACWFEEGMKSMPWNLFHSIGLFDKIQTTHLEASCSVPIFMPPVKIGERYFLDGSISLERPLSAAINMGANKILSIASDRPVPSHLPKYDPNFKPRLSDVVRMLLNRMSHDAAQGEAAQIAALNRFQAALSRKNRSENHNADPLPLFHEDAGPAHYQRVETYSIYPSKRIRYTTGIDEKDLIGAERRKRTRFMFHEKFIRELIALGYEDARAKHDELKTFFSPAPPSKRRWLFFKHRRPSDQKAA